MRPFATEQLKGLVERVAQEAGRTAKKPDADAVHDLRVACRRLTEALRALGSLFNEEDVRKLRKRIRRVLDLAGEVRNRDIVLELLKTAGVTGGPLKRKQMARRREALRALQSALGEWREREWPERWGKRLGIEG